MEIHNNIMDKLEQNQELLFRSSSTTISTNQKVKTKASNLFGTFILFNSYQPLFFQKIVIFGTIELYIHHTIPLFWLLLMLQPSSYTVCVFTVLLWYFNCYEWIIICTHPKQCSDLSIFFKKIRSSTMNIMIHFRKCKH